MVKRLSADAGRQETGARDWATRVVQWDPARTALKQGAHAFARARGVTLKRTGRLPEIANIYTASSPKAGSQWMKALFDHPVVRSHTGLFTLPQLDYQSNPEKGFPLAAFAPGLYVGYDTYRRIPHAHPHRVIYMFRDPRDIVVSGYFSAIATHRDMKGLGPVRDKMRSLPIDEALTYAIEFFTPSLREMATWADLADDNVAGFRLEDVGSEPPESVVKILQHCGVSLTPSELATVLQDVSRDSLQAKDLAQRKGSTESHYRVRRQTFRDLFTPEHHQAVEAAVPGLLTKLRYPN